jgi:hypothetical protein
MTKRTLLLLGLCGTLLGACSATDAPTAGRETFAPISNGAYHVRTGPMVDRGYIQRRPVE